MKVSLILAHPKSGSFNHAIAEVAQNTLESCSHDVSFHDLYMERFDPIQPYEEIPKGVDVNPIVHKYCEEIALADGIIIVHPNWWGMPPAISKAGWTESSGPEWLTSSWKVIVARGYLKDCSEPGKLSFSTHL